jgi:hypothetical protein
MAVIHEALVIAQLRSQFSDVTVIMNLKMPTTLVQPDVYVTTPLQRQQLSHENLLLCYSIGLRKRGISPAGGCLFRQLYISGAKSWQEGIGTMLEAGRIIIPGLGTLGHGPPRPRTCTSRLFDALGARVISVSCAAVPLFRL